MNRSKLVERFRKPLRILAFDRSLKLVGIFQSYNVAEKITGIKRQVILRCCSGQTISAKSLYFREVPEDIIVDIDDLNTLTLLEFDSHVGQDRHIYATRNMKRDEVILESQFKYRFQTLQAKRSEQWKKLKSK